MLSTRSITISEADYEQQHSSLYNPHMTILKNDDVEDKLESPNDLAISLPSPNPQDVFEQNLQQVIAGCPAFIKDIVLKFSSKEEQVMALYSVVSLTGSIMPYVRINYDSKINYPALMLLVIFPPASGKGSMSLIRMLGQKIDEELSSRYRDQIRQYKIDLVAFNKNNKSGLGSLPIEPRQILFLAPGDTTAARLVQQISENGPGQFLTMFETEADVLSDSASNSQYGKGLSTMVRQAFQFETISQMRKKDGELYVAKTPKLSVILSGTANQVTKLFKNNEDGMYSRFMIVIGNAPAKWKDVRPDPTKQPLDIYFTQQAEEFYKMWQFFKNLHVEVKFIDSQWDQINSFGEKHLAVLHNFIDELSGSIAKRHSNMLTRIASVLTMIRHRETGQTGSEVVCTDVDFNIALWMTEQSLKWSLDLYKTLPGKRSNSVVVEKAKMLEALPATFEAKDAENLFKTMKKRTLQRRLRDFVDSNLLEHTGHGKYSKTTMAELALAQLKQDQEDN